jgi:hypothetical protein
MEVMRITVMKPGEENLAGVLGGNLARLVKEE